MEFRPFYDNVRRLPTIPEDFRRLTKRSDDDVRVTLKHLTVFSSEIVNILKLANLTANTKIYGKITLNTKPHSHPHFYLGKHAY